MKKRLVSLVAIVVLVATIAGCSYHHQNFDQTGGHLSGPDDFVIQIDDYGQLWDRKPATDALAKVKALSQRTNVIVLLFVHGWNHSASPDSENVNEFAQTLAKARDLLTNRENPQSSVYRASRLKLTGTEEVFFAFWNH